MITKSRPKLFMDTKTSEGDKTFRAEIKSQAGDCGLVSSGNLDNSDTSSKIIISLDQVNQTRPTAGI